MILQLQGLLRLGKFVRHLKSPLFYPFPGVCNFSFRRGRFEVEEFDVFTNRLLQRFDTHLFEFHKDLFAV
jgi:hypothetical protein